MIKPDERVLVALNTVDHVFVEWLNASYAQAVNDLIDAPRDTVQRYQGAAQELRSILNSIRGARDALDRFRS